MFKYMLVLAFVAYAAATPLGVPSNNANDDAHAEVTLQNAVVRADGFDYALETSNSIHEVQSGDVDGNIHGDFSWVSPEGQVVKVSYVADASGYHPQSDLLPTSPPIPAAIVKSIEYINSHPPQEENKPKSQGK